MGWIDDCRAHCKRIKHLGQEIDWVERPGRTGWLRATSVLLDTSMTSIPGLFLQGEYHPHRRGGEIFSLALMFTGGAETRRVFMLEAYPSHVRSHMDDDREIFGAHIHLGDPRNEQIVKDVKATMEALPLSRWVSRFKAHARVLNSGGHSLKHPFADSLFN